MDPSKVVCPKNSKLVHIQVPYAVLKMDVTLASKLVWGYLYSLGNMTGKVYPSLKTIAKALNIDESTVKRSVKELVAKELLGKLSPTKAEQLAYRKTNRYFVRYPRAESLGAEEIGGELTPVGSAKCPTNYINNIAEVSQPLEAGSVDSELSDMEGGNLELAGSSEGVSTSSTIGKAEAGLLEIEHIAWPGISLYDWYDKMEQTNQAFKGFARRLVLSELIGHYRAGYFRYITQTLSDGVEYCCCNFTDLLVDFRPDVLLGVQYVYYWGSPFLSGYKAYVALYEDGHYYSLYRGQKSEIVDWDRDFYDIFGAIEHSFAQQK